MEIIELMAILERGEDSHHQFKKNVTNADALAAEMAAFSNAHGGRIFVGVDDDGSVTGLGGDDIRRLNQLVSNAASQGVQPAINPETENVMTERGLVVVVSISAGINKPYQDKNGVFWVKSGADKRRATSREEIQRLFQTSGLICADETHVPGMTVSDLDMEYFNAFFQKRYGHTIEHESLPIVQIIQNLNLGSGGVLNVSGALLFAQNPSARLPVFIVKAGCFPGETLAAETYLDSRDIDGRLSDVFAQTVNFIISNLHQVQGSQGINSLGEPEIPRAAIEELVANALIHRDYFISAPVRVFVFRDRVEIISPGHLPNNLTVENIKLGNSNARNPVLASFANHVLPYRGYGSGIIRALSSYPHIEFADDREGNLFTVTMKRMDSN
jgi:ATP-dependent DNA helicase RecG